MSIACVVPTIRPIQYIAFMREWEPLFKQHNVQVVTVWDGDRPRINDADNGLTAEDLLEADADLIYNRSDVCRNLGFAYVAKYMPSVSHILTLDDDVTPYGDTIADHIAALDTKIPISWLSSSPEAYTRGFPYNIREEAPVMVSHGIWYGNADWDAVTQMANNNAPLDTFYKGPVPRGALMPFCGMNVMVKRIVLPWFYFAPMGPRASLDGEIWDRFGDIWLGVMLKRALDERQWAMVSGLAAVNHTRASDVQVNLKKEAAGMRWNELFWQHTDTTPHPYFTMYAEHRVRYQRRIKEFMEWI